MNKRELIKEYFKQFKFSALFDEALLRREMEEHFNIFMVYTLFNEYLEQGCETKKEKMDKLNVVLNCWKSSLKKSFKDSVKIHRELMMSKIGQKYSGKIDDGEQFMVLLNKISNKFAEDVTKFYE